MRQLVQELGVDLHRKVALVSVLCLGMAVSSMAADAVAPEGAAKPQTIIMGGPATGPAAAIATQPVNNGPAPIINADNIEHDFGDVWAGPEVEHAFTISNRGKAPLLIRSVRVDCGCTSTGDHPKVLEPGQSGKFPFRLKTLNLNGRIAPKKIHIVTNDPVTPELTLRLLGTFKKRIEVSPMGASFGTILTTQPLNRVFKIKNNTDQPLQLQLQPVNSEHFKFELKETEPGKAFDLLVSTVTPYKPGIMNAIALLSTSFPEEKIIRVSATGRVPERLDLYPPTANFMRPARSVPGQSSGSVVFWLNNYGASLVNVKQASVDDPAIKTTVENRSPGKNYRIQVDVPFDAKFPPEGRTLTIETDDPEKPTLKAKIIAPALSTATRPAQIRPAKQMVGKPAPAFDLRTFDSVSFTTESLKDKITVMNFVSPSCGYCKRQIPELEKIREAYAAKGIRFINVVNSNPTRRAVVPEVEIAQLMTSLNSHLEVATDPEMVAGNGFQVTSYPTCVLVGKDSKIAAVNVGANEVQLVPAQLDALLAGKPIPAATQPAAGAAH